MTTPLSQPNTELPMGFRLVEISREPIELHKILKFEGLAASGGQAKAAVASGQVRVNGNIEVQKRKKIISGDTIEFNNDKLYIRLSSSVVANTTLSKEQGAKHETISTEGQGSETK